MMNFEMYGEAVAQSLFGFACERRDDEVSATVLPALLELHGLAALSRATVVVRPGSVAVSVLDVPADLESDAAKELDSPAFRYVCQCTLARQSWNVHFRDVRFFAQLSGKTFAALSTRVREACLSRKPLAAFVLPLPGLDDVTGKFTAGVAHRSVRWLAGLANDGDDSDAGSNGVLSVSFHSRKLPIFALFKNWQTALRPLEDGTIEQTVVDTNRVDSWAEGAGLEPPSTVAQYAVREAMLLVICPSALTGELREFVSDAVARARVPDGVPLPPKELEHFWVKGEGDAPVGKTRLRFISFSAREVTNVDRAAILDVVRRSPKLQCVDLSMARGVDADLVEKVASVASVRFVGVRQTGIVVEKLSAEAQRKCCHERAAREFEIAFEAYVDAAMIVAGMWFS
jgi:hypothetical protein